MNSKTKKEVNAEQVVRCAIKLSTMGSRELLIKLELSPTGPIRDLICKAYVEACKREMAEVLTRVRGA